MARLIPAATVPVALLLFPTCMARAATVTFAGTVANLCVLNVTTPGALGLAPAGTSMSSDDSGGVAATMTVVATGGNPTISFAAPTLTGPAGSTSSTTKEIEYTSGGGANQGYTSSASSYAMNRLLDTFTVKGRLTNAAGFVSGTYTLSTVATCQQ